MRNLVPFGFRTLRPFERLPWEMDRVLNQFLGPQESKLASSLGEVSPAIDLRETEAEILVSAEVPGVAPEDLELSVQDDVLTLAGEKRAEEVREDERGTYTERVYGSFRRDVQLPSPVDSARAEAEHKNGVVTIRLPKAESVRPRRIDIRTGS